MMLLKKIRVVSVTLLFIQSFLTASILSSLFEKNSVFDHEENQHIEQVMVCVTQTAFEFFKQGHLFLFDGVTGDNQCHLNAFIVAQLFKQKDALVCDLINEKSVLPHWLSFLTLNLLRSSVFQKQRARLPVLIKLVIKKMPQGLNEKKISNLLQDVSILEKARIKLVDMRISLIQKYLCEGDFHEFVDALQDVPVINNIKTVPKYLGIHLFLKLIQRHQIPIIFQVKIICDNGTHLLSLGAENIQHDCPAIVIDAVSCASSSLQSMAVFCNARKNCSKNYANAMKKCKQNCNVCVVHDNNMCQQFMLQCEKLKKMKPQEVQLIIASSFMKQQQPEGEAWLQNQAPDLFAQYEKHAKNANEMGLGWLNCSTLFIEHMYPITAEQSLEQRIVDTTTDCIVKRFQSKKKL